MTDYSELIELLNQAKDLYIKDKSPLVPINVALIKLIALESEQNYQINQMGREYEESLKHLNSASKHAREAQSTLRSTIDEIDRLSGGELKSTWKRK